MSISKVIKTVLLSLVYAINIFFARCLWWAGLDGNIMLGILLIIFYRLSLWLAPIAVTLICWLPSKPKMSARKKLILNVVHLMLCGLLFVLCYLLFGNWY